MRGLVFFNLHHVIFGLTTYLKKLLLSILSMLKRQQVRQTHPRRFKVSLSMIKKEGRVEDTR